MSGTEAYKDKRGHTPYTCADPECTGCGYCTGGLDCCTVCNGAEGSMPSQCPGVRMTSVQVEEVYAGRLDYRDGIWIATTPPRSLWGVPQTTEGDPA